jgi:hypothetical protein
VQAHINLIGEGTITLADGDNYIVECNRDQGDSAGTLYDAFQSEVSLPMCFGFFSAVIPVAVSHNYPLPLSDTIGHKNDDLLIW